MSLYTQVKGLFTPHAVAAAMEQLPPMETTVVDTLFPGTVEHPFVHIGIADLENVIGTQPVVRRDGQPVPFQGKGDDVNFFAPRPIKPAVKITASELNDLKAIWGNEVTIQQFVSRQIDKLRHLVRNTTEAMASVVVTTGRLSWPSRVEGGGHENYELDFGGVVRDDLPVKWSAAVPPTLGTVYNWLSGLKRAVSKAGGGGGKFCFLAGTQCRYGYAEDKNILIRLVFLTTTAPILNSFRRTVPRLELASSVPAKAKAVNLSSRI